MHSAPTSSILLHPTPLSPIHVHSAHFNLHPAQPSSTQLIPASNQLKILQFFIFVYKFQFKWSECFFNFRSSTRKSRSQFCLRKRSRKIAKKATHFAVHFHSKNLTHFMDLNWLDIDDNMLPQHRQKPLQK